MNVFINLAKEIVLAVVVGYMCIRRVIITIVLTRIVEAKEKSWTWYKNVEGCMIHKYLWAVVVCTNVILGR